MKTTKHIYSSLLLKLWVKILIGLVLGIWSSISGAITIHALYTSACKREVGVILGVNERQITLLNLNGQILSVDRYEVIYHVSYPLDAVPIQSVKNPQVVSQVKVWTYQNGELQLLVSGWPVDFSADKVAFLSVGGVEVVIDRSSIWKIAYEQESQSIEFRHRSRNDLEFIHPYAFSNCPRLSESKTFKIYPQQLLSDPIAIKREMDRLAMGHHGLRKYDKAQQFYPVPEVYTNQTSLGLWLMTGSRYGASSNRKNNFTPLLENEFSSGPFGFQSEFRSGSGPILQSIHEETQTHILYRFKADYFHMSTMADPNLLLVGQKYKWGAIDLGSRDARMVEDFFLEFGFDYGRLSLEFYTGGAVRVASKLDSFFQEGAVDLPRIGIRFQHHTWTASLQGGSSLQDSGFKLYFGRANLDWKMNRDWRWQLSAIKRKLVYDGFSDLSLPQFKMNSSSHTVATYLYTRFKSRYWVGGFVSAENIENQYSRVPSSEDSAQDWSFKLGTMISLNF